MKWCSGLCGRQLPLDAFYKSASGHYGACKGCHRVRARESFRKRYSRSTFRQRWNRKVAAWRKEHMAQVRAWQRARYWRRKVAA
jgi:uncharacterized ParB-like nuclease family protein